jgi:hypothetical protein
MLGVSTADVGDSSWSNLVNNPLSLVDSAAGHSTWTCTKKIIILVTHMLHNIPEDLVVELGVLTLSDDWTMSRLCTK